MTLRDRIEFGLVWIAIVLACVAFWITVLPWMWDFLLGVQR